MARIIVVSEYTSEAQNSTGYFWQKAIEKLDKDGLDVIVITPNRSLKDSVRENVILRAIVKVKTAAWLGWRTARVATRDDIVFSGTNPEMLLCLMGVLKRFVGFRWNVLVHDVFPENLVPAGVLRPDRLAYRFLKLVFSWVYSQADLRIVIGRDMKRLIEEKTGYTGHTAFIHNWVDALTVKHDRKENNTIIQSLGWQDKVVFQFFGNLGRLQGIENILAAIPLVQTDRAAFLFIGTGVGVEKVVEFANANPSSPVRYMAALPQHEKEMGLTACDIAIIPLQKGMYGLGVPSKAYFTLAADRPIFAIMDAGSEIALMVEEERVGWTCAPDDPVQIAAYIDQICATDLRPYIGRMRNVLETKYSQDVALNRLSAVVQS